MAWKPPPAEKWPPTPYTTATTGMNIYHMLFAGEPGHPSKLAVGHGHPTTSRCHIPVLGKPSRRPLPLATETRLSKPQQ